MRILHVGKYYPPVPGGMEYFLRDLGTALYRKGIATGILVHHDKPRLPSSYELLENISVWRTRVEGHVGFVPISSSFPKRLRDCIHEFRPDLLHFHMPNSSAFWALCIPEARKIPWVIHWHSDVIPSGFDIRLRSFYPFYSMIEQIFLRRSQAIIATSPDYLQASISLRNFLSKCRIIPLAIDAERLSRCNQSALRWAERTWGSTSFRLLSVGRLTYYKGFNLLIEAMTYLPQDISLHIVGTGILEASLRERTYKLGVENRVVFHGYIEDDLLSALYQTTDCFVLGSFERTESFGVVLLEAMWHEKPIIASNISGSGVRWLVQQAQCGILFEPQNATDCASKILWMKNHPKEAIMYGKSGKSFLVNNLLIDRIANEISTLYESLI